MSMIISVINMSDRALDDADLQAGIRASIGRLPMTSPLNGALARSFASKARPVADRASIKPT
jgi:hypothetical protein